METPTHLRFAAFGLLLSLPLAHSYAGADPQRVEPRLGAAAAAVEFESYLQAQKVNHSIDISDTKSAPQGSLTVKIYGVLPSGQQDAICGAMGVMARRTRTETSTVQFYALVQHGAAAVSFQPSRLPSGNGEVSVSRASTAPTYKLMRTARL